MKLPGHVTDIEALFDLSPDLLCFIDSQGYFIKVNKAFKDALGYTQEELLSKPFINFIDPDNWQATNQQVAALARNETISQFENRYLCMDGSYKWFSWNAFQLPDKTCFASARDITHYKIAVETSATEKEKQKKQLLQNEHRLISLIESGDDIILILTAEGVYKFVSPSVKAILNSDPEFYIGKVTFQFIHPDDLEWVGGEFKAVLETEKPVYIAPFRFQIASGEWVWIETIATNRLNDPAIEGIVINAKNVTRKIQEEQEKLVISEQLQLSNERYRLVIEATKDVIWDWNLETQRLTRDISFQKLFGYKTTKETEASNGAWEDYIFPEDKDRVLKSINEAIVDPKKKYWHEEYRFLRADHTIALISDHGYIIRNLDQKAVRMVGAMHDRTEGQDKEQQILRQNKRLIEVALITSHQLRRPVATILALVALLDKSGFDQENQEIIGHLEITASELDAVIRRINDHITD
jgi:PAS domain S-box-containing protein